MKRLYLLALSGLSVALSSQAMAQSMPTTPPQPMASAPTASMPVVAQPVSAGPAAQSNANPFKPKDPAPPAASGPQPAMPPMPAVPMPMQMPQVPVPGANGENPKKLGTLNGVAAYRGTDSSYQFIKGSTQ